VRAPIVLLTLLAVLVFAPWARAQDARATVEQFVARLSEISVTDMVVTQILTLYDPKDSRQQVIGQQRLLIKLPARQRVETDMAGEREVRLLHGHRLVVERGGKVFEAPPLERAHQRAHTLVPFRRTAADLLVEWRSLGVLTEVARTVRAGARTVTVIGAREGDRTSPAVWLDPEYGVIRFITREEGPVGVKLLDLAFSEHRKVSAGFFYPFRQEIFLDGKLLSVTSVRNVEVNTGLPDALFDPDALLKGASR
jgi:outer membrane lipoprotein-sorting protein